MNPVRARHNLYAGVNAHLHSLFQSDDGWSSLHTTHIVHLAAALQEVLQPLGYEADVEQSLQIRRADGLLRQPRAAVLIYDTGLHPRAGAALPVQSTAAEVVLPIPTMMNMPETDMPRYRAVAVFERTESLAARREPVGWIELLSPSNKPPHSDFDAYYLKREALLQAGIVFVELDYLHHFPPTFAGVADYTQEANAYPYRITVIDPRPEFLRGEGRSRGFRVDEAIPAMTIPLNAGDSATFDFDLPYQRTFYEMFYGNRVDYAQLPVNFERYSPEDQRRIVNRMLGVIEAAGRGEVLSPALSPLIYTLDDALARLESLRGQ